MKYCPFSFATAPLSSSFTYTVAPRRPSAVWWSRIVPWMDHGHSCDAWAKAKFPAEISDSTSAMHNKTFPERLIKEISWIIGTIGSYRSGRLRFRSQTEQEIQDSWGGAR